ncbi:hypothetical protein HanRHA438_Chr15g0718641 [Helianthus annuus]|uniref:Uncharacterized protein n=1 Tax=Helianthus annuus TaxID=4232 RepID=A0A9K3H5N5_HELAN|nr:hypothetical protein HanXRQr2_Chr15g0706461 [Helianthus annuus]KAJ0452158.1 hypothetical protein HanHA300_Chr15g0575771 [Helianthus annuus]KAJ0456961.1 hypothetical protein HanIR_Chr15g0768401 [Helianthus annuus]KAJ0474064.1 hypothetical protein HanHA89_Chr15g0625491 [Helianthus annuus]KAJ0649628.1 hypothetical protein HanLR1_Chr15g0586481 [Helianthus annuus]
MDFLQGISWSVAVVLISIMYFFGRDVSGGSFVIAARVIFSVLGVSVLGVLIYTLILKLSPSYTTYFAS